ncbi:ABC transporter ATP-binding protein [Herbaspirillum camelliae]|uniref:ABC transporter ATP-binding protein n=1 Tax=Herbaspirillum camelliae TaxID=1892903 RepID=UPI00094A0396|nr:ATP-binding cassette domain-containing protein [Herbaspirillum camelliae]
MVAIALKGVEKSFGEHTPVLRNIDLDIGENEFCVFLGPSGCGKSTLLRIIAGLEDATSGDVHIGGRIVNAVPPSKRGVAMVFQSYALFPHMTVEQNLGFGLKLAGVSVDEIARKVNGAAKILQLEPLLKRKPVALSGGQRQRVSIGRAIVREPGVFLFDEPLSNLDTMLRGQTRVEIAKLHRQFARASTVYVTHDQVEAMTLGDKIVLLRAGKDAECFGSIAQVGSPLDLYHRPNSRFVAEFIGSPKMNILDGSVMAINDEGASVKLERTNEIVSASVDGASLKVGQPVQFGIRPEHFADVSSLSSANEENGHTVHRDTQVFLRNVTLVERLGEHSYVHVEDRDQTIIIAKQAGDTNYKVGAPIALHFHSKSCHLFTADGRAVPKR